MSESELFFALLRINAAQILRYSGIAGAKPSVLDAFTDMIARYIMLLGTTTRQITESSGRSLSEVEDARSALEHVGLLLPLVFDNHEEDTRAVDAFVDWAKGTEAEEMRRVAGMEAKDSVELPMPDTVIPVVKMDWITTMKMKEGRLEDGERYRGTVLGLPAEAKKVVIEGGDAVKFTL